MICIAEEISSLRARLDELELRTAKPGTPTKIFILLAVASRYFDVRQAQLLGRQRNRNIARARQVGMVVARRMGYGLEQVGEFFGGRDHATVMHAMKSVASRPESMKQVEEIEAKLTGVETPEKQE